MASTYAQSISDISGRIHGLELAVEALSIPPAAVTNDDVVKVLSTLEKHKQMLRVCLRVYEPALKETSKLAGTTVKYQTTCDNARLISGNIDYAGEVIPVSVDKAGARWSRMFNGNMSSHAAKNFWK